MKKTKIDVSRETATRVQKAKYDLGCKTADETINRIFDIVEKIEVNKQ